MGWGVRKGTPLASRVAQGVSGPSESCVWNPRVFASQGGRRLPGPVRIIFLSREDRDLGVAFQTHLVSQALSRGVAKDSILLSSRDGYLLEPTKWPKGSQASCGVWKEDSAQGCIPKRLLGRPD